MKIWNVRNDIPYFFIYEGMNDFYIYKNKKININMIYLYYEKPAQVFITTLYENLTGDTLSQSGLSFIFEFTNEQSKEVHYRMLDDISLNPYRYNKFIINNIDDDFIPGFYKYRVYLNYNCLEVGRCYIEKSIDKKEYSINTERKVYKNK